MEFAHKGKFFIPADDVLEKKFENSTERSDVDAVREADEPQHFNRGNFSLFSELYICTYSEFRRR